MGGGLDAEPPGGTEQLRPSRVDAPLGRQRVARVEVQQDLERGEALPEGKELGVVVVLPILADARVAVDAHAFEPEVPHRSLELRDRRLGSGRATTARPANRSR